MKLRRELDTNDAAKVQLGSDEQHATLAGTVVYEGVPGGCRHPLQKGPNRAGRRRVVLHSLRDVLTVNLQLREMRHAAGVEPVLAVPCRINASLGSQRKRRSYGRDTA